MKIAVVCELLAKIYVTVGQITCLGAYCSSASEYLGVSRVNRATINKH